MILNRKHIVFIILSFGLALGSIAQSTVKLVTRKIEQSWETKDGCQIYIAADKAHINIEQSTNNTLEVELKLIAKHANVEVAKKEVQYLKYNLSQKGNNYYLNNSILLPKKTVSAESRLMAVYTLKIPKGIYVEIKNSLGNTSLSGIRNNINISVSYGNVYINSCSGKLNATTKVGDIDIKKSTFEANLETEYSEINMEDINGQIKIESRFGNINLEPGIHLTELNIDAHKANVSIFNTNLIEYNLDINTEHGAIKTNKKFYIKSGSLLKESKSKGETTKLLYPLLGNSSAIKINSRFSTVNLH